MARPARLLAALGPDAAGPSDADLLARFASGKDAGAFELLVYRHAPLVLRACRAALRDRHAAEDAAQAVFLALARQARSVRGETLAGWLFRVSRRVAARAARRQPPAAADVDLDALAVEAAPAVDPTEARVLHDELARLPESYRAPILLCYFEGLSRAEAARRLGWPEGTVAGRLARAKERLAARLLRRGVVPSLLLVAVEVVPPGFAAEVAQAAVAYSAGSTAGLPPAVVRLITQETRRTVMSKLAKVVGAALSVGVVAVALGTMWGGEPRAAAQPGAAQPATVAAQPAPAPPKAVFGKAFVVAPVTTALQQRLLPFGGADSAVYVSLDGRRLFPDDRTLAVDALDVKGVRETLAKFGPGPGRAVHFDVYFLQATGDRTPDHGPDVVNYALEGLARQVGFGRARAANTYAFGDWAEHIAPLRDPAGADAREDAVGDERVRAYPVRTPLGRVLTGSAAGVADVRVRIDGRAGAVVPDGVGASARAALRALGVPRGSRVNALFDVQERDGRTSVRMRELAGPWVEAEGLELGSVGY